MMMRNREVDTVIISKRCRKKNYTGDDDENVVGLRQQLVSNGTTQKVISVVAIAYGTFKLCSWAWNMYSNNSTTTNNISNNTTTTTTKNDNTSSKSEIEITPVSTSIHDDDDNDFQQTLMFPLEFNMGNNKNNTNNNNKNKNNNKKYGDINNNDHYKYNNKDSKYYKRIRRQCQTMVSKYFIPLGTIVQKQIDTMTDISKLTSSLKKLRNSTSTVSNNKNKSNGGCNNGSNLTTTKEQLWEQIQIETFTRTVVSGYIYIVLYLLLTIQINLIQADLSRQTDHRLYKQQDNYSTINNNHYKNNNNYDDDDYDDDDYDDDDDAHHVNKHTVNEQNNVLLLQMKQLLQDVLQQTIEIVLLQETLPIIVQIVRQAVQQSFSFNLSNHNNTNNTNTNTNTNLDDINNNDSCWKVMSSHSLNMTHDQFRTKFIDIHRIFLFILPTVLSSSSSSLSSSFSIPAAVPDVINDSNQDVNSRQLYRDVAIGLVQILTSSPSALQIQQTSISTTTNNDNNNKNCNTTTTSSTSNSIPSVGDYYSKKVDDDDDEDNRRVLLLPMLFDETLDLMESPIAYDAASDMLQCLFDDYIIRSLFTTTIDETTTTTTTAIQPLKPLATCLSELKRIISGTKLYPTTTTPKITTEDVVLYHQKKNDTNNNNNINNNDPYYNHFCQQLTRYQSIQDLTDTCFHLNK